MSQNYKIVERLDKVADAAMYTEDSPYQGDSPFGEQIRQAASLIKELGEALSDAQQFVGGMAVTFEREGFPEELDAEDRALILGLRAKIDAILSKLKEA